MKNQFYNINALVNANAIPMRDDSKWISWSKDQINRGLSKRKINLIAQQLTQ